MTAALAFVLLGFALLPGAAQGVEFRVTERLTVKQGLEVSTSATASPLLFISSTTGAGNVGIGTSGPNVRLDVSSNAFVRGVGGVYNNPGAAELQVGYGFGVGGTAGSVSRLALQPYGHTGGPWKFVARDDASKAYLDWVYGGAATGVTQDSSGNVGIGTTAPGVTLDVQGPGRFINQGAATNASSGKGLEIQYVTSGRAQGEGSYLIPFDRTSSAYQQFVVDAGTITLATNASARMTIAKDGNVGIGTTNPAAKLDVAGDVRTTGNLRMPNRVWFTAGKNAGWQGLAAGWQIPVLETVLAGNSGGWYNTTTGVFTAPVAGAYLCTLNIYMDGSTNTCSTMYTNIACNGSNSGCYGKTGAGGSTHHKIKYTNTNQESSDQAQLIYLPAGETVNVSLYSSVACTNGWYGFHSNFGCVLLSAD